MSNYLENRSHKSVKTVNNINHIKGDLGDYLYRQHSLPVFENIQKKIEL